VIEDTLERHRRVTAAEPERFLGELLRLMRKRAALRGELGDPGASAARAELAAFRDWLESVGPGGSTNAR
jgi:hypothetical protein